MAIDQRTKTGREAVAERKRAAAAEAILNELFGEHERLVPINFLAAGTPALGTKNREQVKKLLLKKMAAIGLT